MSIFDDPEPLELGGDLTPGVKYLIIATTACFVVQQLLLPPEAIRWLALVPDSVIHRFAVWQLVSYMFLHGDAWHIVFNMLALWIIGRELEFYWGTNEFLRFYFICGIGAAILDVMVSFSYTHATMVPAIGASGAIYGLLVAFGFIFWDRYVTLLVGYFLPVTIKVKYLVVGLGLIALYFGLMRVPDGIGHFAHLGGMVVGFVYMKLIKPDLRWGENIFNQKTRKTGLGKWLLERLDKWRQTETIRQRQQEAQMRERVDLILDKINEVGYENLTAEEKQSLRNASENLSQEDSQQK